MSDRISYNISLPQEYWDKIDERREQDCLIRSRGDALISILREVYPELNGKVKA